MAYQALKAYLARLDAQHTGGTPSAKVWLDEQGRAAGRFFNTSIARWNHNL